MKHLLALITCILLPLFSAWDLSGQEQTLRFPERKMKIADVFSAIEKQTDYTVAYNESVLNAGKVVTVPERKSLTEVLTAIPDFDSLKIPFFLRSDNQYIVKSADFSG